MRTTIVNKIEGKQKRAAIAKIVRATLNIKSTSGTYFSEVRTSPSHPSNIYGYGMKWYLVHVSPDDMRELNLKLQPFGVKCANVKAKSSPYYYTGYGIRVFKLQ